MKTIILPEYQTLKRLLISYKPAVENYFTAVAVPTTEPTTSQIKYTVDAADLPTLNMGVESKIIVALIYAAGYNNTGSTITLYWRILKNGTSIRTGSNGVGAEYSWTLNAYFTNVAVGDVLELRFWASASGLYYEYNARQLQFSQIKLLSKYPLAMFQIIGDLQPKLTSGVNPYPYNQYMRATHASGAYLDCGAGTTILDWWKQHGTYGLFRVGYGDYYKSNTVDYNGSAPPATGLPYEPYYNRNYVPAEIRIRPLKPWLT